MRVYLNGFYGCDEWITGRLKNNRKRLMKLHGLSSLTFSYTLPENGPEIKTTEDNELTRAVIESVLKVISVK